MLSCQCTKQVAPLAIPTFLDAHTELLFTRESSSGGSGSLPLLPECETYRNLCVEWCEEQRALWCFMQPTGRPSFTPDLLADLARMQKAIRSTQEQRPINFLVYGSACDKVFNRGGDLDLFADCAERGDLATLRQYAHQCVGIVHDNHRGYGHDIVTISLVQGDALGGGLEAALSSDIVVAERGSKMGFPEVKLNIFPGMGAHLLLPFRIGNAATDRLIRGGLTYTAEELQAMGVVDHLAEPGMGHATVFELMHSMAARFNAHASIFEARRRTSGVSLQALEDIADIWVETVQRLDEEDLRRIRTVVAAQDRALCRGNS